ncbi:MAG: hypothetical protein B6A08_07145 [Sorangiineae bacterium NIC37A_2]|jgi:hypothetical protein|nr:MAG: hypothetical protein B6A08_07145 [Sorangiineae bacterium NIC37A_2]
MSEGKPLRTVPVDWEALEDAFENNAPEVHSYLHIATGEVIRVVDGIADPGMHSRIATDPSYLRIDPVSSREQYRWMERFIPMVEDEEVKRRLSQAIDGKGAFRRFKDVLMSYSVERERWFEFRSERLRVFMEAWLSAHALEGVVRAAVPPESSPLPDPTRAAETRPRRVGDDSGSRYRGADSVRRQILDVLDGLGSRELEKVLVFAEFVLHRHGGRASPERRGATVVSVPSSSSAVDGKEAFEPDPPTQRRAAERR